MIKKHIFQHLLLLCFLTLPLSASIDSQIDAIRNAPISERFKLMNALKKDVVHMQEAERIDAISKLKSITRSKHSARALSELKQNHRMEHTKKYRRIKKEYEHRDDHENDSLGTEDHIEDESEDHIENETEDHIEDETEDHIEDETEDHIEDETEDHIEDEHDDDD